MNAIEIRNLTKNFKEKQALCGLNMTVPVGSIYGFIGENGSGKSTTEKLICGLLMPSGGEWTSCPKWWKHPIVWERLYRCRCKSKNRMPD